ncbi:hypothetical protein CRG98_018377 [Punica granatum]|uniref:Uncharacterized protein n=1 Tax=Punica granatum TaxID=22663 RepID=A0A2I0JY23_PUNGR|nr:hypothetical protein CRG98_018377 [Punica granatum]
MAVTDQPKASADKSSKSMQSEKEFLEEMPTSPFLPKTKECAAELAFLTNSMAFPSELRKSSAGTARNSVTGISDPEAEARRVETKQSARRVSNYLSVGGDSIIIDIVYTSSHGLMQVTLKGDYCKTDDFQPTYAFFL